MKVQVLAIETSCDETAVSVLSEDKHVIFNKILSQDHSLYGGVFPEIASRNHLAVLEKMVSHAVNECNFSHVAVTGGPGLIGGVMVGLMMAKGIASASKKTFLAINHLEAHILTSRFSDKVNFPFLALLISGGHCQIVAALEVGHYKILGKTLDDALGESFDKIARMLNLGYPGGPIVEKMAKNGNSERFTLVKPMYKRKCCNFSFAGLKTAVKNLIYKLGNLSEQDKCDICASFQRVVCDTIIDRLTYATKIFKQTYNGKHFAVVGGVAANSYIRKVLEKHTMQNNMIFSVPPASLCTDNAIMIGWAALEYIRKNSKVCTNLNFSPKARWSLESV